MNYVEVPFISFEDVINGYKDDQFFDPVVDGLENKWSTNFIEKLKLEKIVSMFRNDCKRLLYNGKVFVPRRSVSTILVIAHDSKVGGHLKFGKTLSLLSNFHW